MHRIPLTSIIALVVFGGSCTGEELTKNQATSPAELQAATGSKVTVTDLPVKSVEEAEKLAFQKSAGASAAGGFGEFNDCSQCMTILQRIKKGTNMLLPSICAVEGKSKSKKKYAACAATFKALQGQIATDKHGNALFEGCYKYEEYAAKEWVKPCPTHVMCSVLKNLDNQPFCQPLSMEDPFKKAAPTNAS